ncbi:MAG: hypothetical protein Aurels2KO_29840 [Aureliella sp.]
MNLRLNALCPLNKVQVLVVLLLAIAVAGPATAKPPSFLDIFRKKPSGPLELKPEHGPWLIMATVITEGDAEKKAKALAEEIRQSLRIPAFVMHRTGGTPEKLGEGLRVKTDVNTGQRIATRLESRFINGGIEEGYAVLVGEFDSPKDDGNQEIDRVLKQVRSLQPKSLSGEAEKDLDKASTNWIVQKYRSAVWSRNDRTQQLGPLGRAFVTKNPLLPDEYFLDSPKLDQFVTKLNKDVEYSLLKCPGKYTVRVASFTGKEVTGFGADARTSDTSTTEVTSQLDRAALRAHQMTTRLRKRNIEAYEFHDRFGSYVSIGSFDSLGHEVDGEFQYNRAMRDVATKFCGYETVNAQNPITKQISPIPTLKTVDRNPKDSIGRIPFDLEGKPMAVPKPSSSIYGGSLLGGR